MAGNLKTIPTKSGAPDQAPKSGGVSKSSTTARHAERSRLNFRIDPRIKARAENAATLLGQDLSAFAEIALDEKAQAVMEREERIVLSEEQFARFVEIMDDPAPPTPKLVRAMKRYQAAKAAHPERGL